MYPFRRWSEEWLWSNLSKSDSCCITNAQLGIKDKTKKPVYRRGPGGGLGEGGSKVGCKCRFALAVTKGVAVSASPRRLLLFVSCADNKK